jgi:hypothetical protein
MASSTGESSVDEVGSESDEGEEDAEGSAGGAQAGDGAHRYIRVSIITGRFECMMNFSHGMINAHTY